MKVNDIRKMMEQARDELLVEVARDPNKGGRDTTMLVFRDSNYPEGASLLCCPPLNRSWKRVRGKEDRKRKKKKKGKKREKKTQKKERES